MNDRKYIIGIIAVMILSIVIIGINKKRVNKNDSNINIETSYNNETQMYEIKDENGEVLHSAHSEDELYIYKTDPNYDAKSTDIDTEEIDNY